MRLGFMFVARSAEIADGKLSILGADFDMIMATALPATHPALDVVLKLILSPNEFRITHKVESEIIGPDDRPITGRVKLYYVLEKTDIPGGDGRIPVVMTFLLTRFPSEGTYWARAIVNDAEIGRVPIHVRLAPRPERQVNS